MNPNPAEEALRRKIHEVVANSGDSEARARIDALLANKDAIVNAEDVLRDAVLLSTIDYDQRRKRLAARLGFTRPAVFDQEVEKLRPTDEDDELQGSVVTVSDVEPWTEEVNGGELLNEISSLARRHVYFPNPTDADMFSLWTLGTYGFDLFDLFPFLGITAPGENSGKSTLLKLANRTVCRPISTANITPAALFRLIAMYQCTVLIDEMDTFLNPESELYGILNSGHEKELAYVVRTVGEDHEPRRFTTWCPRAYAMIGLPKRTLLSRSIVTRLLRKPKEVNLEPLPELRRMRPDWERRRRQCARWVLDNKERLQNADVGVDGLVNRSADNWKPLFLIASTVGGDWLTKARCAAGVPEVVNGEEINTVLLRDVRNIFDTRKTDRLPCAVLTLDLCQQIESPWAHYDHHNPLTVNQLGDLLGSLGIKSKPFKMSKQLVLSLGLRDKWKNNTVRGFHKEQFQALFDSYLSGEEVTEVKISTTDDPF